jgi:hypothetical protein
MAYEFTPEQERSIGKLAGSMSVVGGFMIFVALLGLVGIAFMAYQLRGVLERAELTPEFVQVVGLPLVAPSINVLILVLFGLLTRRAAGYFKMIVETEGEDIEHLMGALGSLRTLYGVQYTIILLGLILAILGVGAAGYLAFLR